MERSAVGQVAEGAAGIPQGVRDAIADARTLVVFVMLARPHSRTWRALEAAQDRGSDAHVACMDGKERLAVVNAREAAHAAFRAVPGLRG